ncbi:MAG: hypothetical protein HQL83_17040 [Magnetococcales bacterium]|nr:hypothetical protein [Magnetococcales bacterium]
MAIRIKLGPFQQIKRINWPRWQLPGSIRIGQAHAWAPDDPWSHYWMQVYVFMLNTDTFPDKWIENSHQDTNVNHYDYYRRFMVTCDGNMLAYNRFDPARLGLVYGWSSPFFYQQPPLVFDNGKTIDYSFWGPFSSPRFSLSAFGCIPLVTYTYRGPLSDGRIDAAYGRYDRGALTPFVGKPAMIKMFKSDEKADEKYYSFPPERILMNHY